MLAKIHYLHGQPTPIGHFVRVGYSGYRQLETLFESGRFKADRVVVDAARYDAQRDLIHTLWDSGTEIVLDPQVAELSSLGRFEGACRELAWAVANRPLAHADFADATDRRIVKLIAEFAARRRVDTILAPTHLVEGARDPWVEIDTRACELLRVALDEAGKTDIAIDYQLLLPYGVLRDPAHRGALLETLDDLPFQNLWIRVAGFGADATGVGIKKCVSGFSDFHALRKPVVVDCAGGLAALGLAAFGAASAISHGVAEKERFDTRSWRARPKSRGGQTGRLYLPGLDRYFKLQEAKAILEARGGRRLLACPDRECCPRGVDDMQNDPKAHFLTQRLKQLRDLERTPDLRRRSRYLDHHLTSADRTARQAAKLRVDDLRLGKALLRTTQRLDRMRSVLEDLDRTLGPDAARSEPVSTRAPVQARREKLGG